MTLSELATEHTPCLYCGAPAGERCRTATNGRATYVHADRTRAVWPIWNDGFITGLRDALADPDSAQHILQWHAEREASQ